MKSINRYFKFPDQSFFLFGPRGTGKTTCLKQKAPDALVIDLLATDVLREYLARPERLIQTIDAHPGHSIILIDEIQMAPQLLSIVHAVIEQKRALTFALTGSSARKLKKTGVDLLAGRALKRTMHPFMASELGALFDIKSALTSGLVPIVVAAPDPAATLKTYLDLYIREEVQMEGMVRDIGAFTRFLEAAALTHGQILNLTNVAQDCQVGRKTVEGYFSILQDLLLCTTIPVFTKRAQRALIAHPKLYFFDCGVYRSLRPRGPLDNTQEISGAGLEGLILQHLRAWIEYGGLDASVSFWHTRAGLEVDFVIYGEALFYAIEVKMASRVKSEHLRGLKAFKADYPQCTPLLLYMGSERLRIDDIDCIGCTEFLKGLVPGKAFWPSDESVYTTKING